MDLEHGARVDVTVELAEDREEGGTDTLHGTTADGTEVTVVVGPSAGLHPFADGGSGPFRVFGARAWSNPPSGGGPGGDRERGTEPDGTTHGEDRDALRDVVTTGDVEWPVLLVDAETIVDPADGPTTARDDWRPRTDADPGHQTVQSAASAPVESQPVASEASPADTVGLAAGGAKDAANFRDNVREGYTPQPDAIATEGLFYDYQFETGDRDTDGDALFAPQCATAVAPHPIEERVDRYLSVGLDSTLSLDDFERPRLDLVVALDVSGSMDSPFRGYYYDADGRRRETDDPATDETKLEAAITSLCALTHQLEAEDRLGVVLFDNRAHVAKPLRSVRGTDMDAIRSHVRDVQAGGGTNMADGFEAAAELLADGDPDRERRVVFMTDAMPNTGATGESALTSLFAEAAGEGIHATFVGMGIDANADLVETLSGIRGANHYFVHSGAEFERRLGEEFDYMVTPLVHDLQLEIEGGEVVAAHGTPDDDAAGPLVSVPTLFASPSEDGESRGSVVLLRVADAPDAVELVASWTERGGQQRQERVTVDLPDGDGPAFDHDGVRKAVALARYAEVLRAWATDVHDRAAGDAPVDDWLLPAERGEHEREGVPLVVPPTYAAQFSTLHEHLSRELRAVGDETMERELALLEQLYECTRMGAVDAEAGL